MSVCRRSILDLRGVLILPSRIVYIGWLYSIVSSSLIYLALVILFPPAFMTEARAAKFESWADDQQELLDRGGPGHGTSRGSVDEEKVEAKIGHELGAVVREAAY